MSQISYYSGPFVMINGMTPDYVGVRNLIKSEIVRLGGFDSLTDSDKRICARFGLATNDYIWATFTPHEIVIMQKEVYAGIKLCNKERYNKSVGLLLATLDNDDTDNIVSDLLTLSKSYKESRSIDDENPLLQYINSTGTYTSIGLSDRVTRDGRINKSALVGTIASILKNGRLGSGTIRK